MPAAPVLSVCVSTYQRAARLDRLLAALERQAAEVPLEVVVYDDASCNTTPQVLASWGDRLPLVVLRGDRNRGPASGRNAAWRRASAPTVLFTDDDCVPQPGWAAEHAAAAGPRRVCVGRTVPDPGQAHLAGPFSRTLEVPDARFFQTANVSYPTALLEELGGFHEGFRRAAGEDTDLGCRAREAGAEVAFLPAALVHHDVRPSDWTAALRETTKWVDIPLFGRRHAGDVDGILHTRRWWRASHPRAVLAAVGLVGTAVEPWLLLLVLPWLRFRTTTAPVQARRRQWAWVLPGQLALDVSEVLVLARGSVRHRHLLL